MTDASEHQYTEEEWPGCRPTGLLDEVGDRDLALLHRHWIWANFQRTLFDEYLKAQRGQPPDEHFATLAGGGPSTMLLWYSLLWAIIEAFDDRDLQLAGRFAEDIDAVRDDLRRCRNAVLHVPGSGDLYDQRIVTLLSRPDFVGRVRRISPGFGRLFLEEVRARSGGSADLA